MVFGLLKGAQVTLGIEVDRPKKPYYPGDVIHATVSIQSASKVKVREVFAGLALWEKYQYGTTDDEGDKTKSWATAEDFAVRETLMGEGEIPAGFSETYHLDFPVPTNATPPYSGKIVQNRWLLRVTLDRPMKRDISEEVEIPLIVPPPPDAEGERTDVTHLDEADIAFVLPKLAWVEGAELAGRLRISPRQDFSVSGVHLELVRQEYVPRDEGNVHAVKEAEVELAGKTKFAASQSVELPFAVTIPRQGCPSRRTGRSIVTWSLQVRLSRRLAKDRKASQDIRVHNGMAPA